VKRPWPREVDDPDPTVRARRTRLALETVIERIRPGTLFYPVLLAAYAMLVLGDRVDLIATVGVLGVQLGLACGRHVLYRHTTAARAADPDRWRRSFAYVSATVMFVWDAFVVFEIWHRHLDAKSLLLLLSSLLLRGAGTYAASPDLYFHAVWSRWSRLPMFIAPLVLLPTRDALILIVAFAGHMLYAEAQCRQLNAEFWRRIAATDALECVEVELRLAQKLESVGRLAAGIAHELNTPLQAIMSNLAFIEDGMTELLDAARGTEDIEFFGAKLPEAVAEANASVARAATIVRSMRSFSHPDATAKAPLDINDVLATALTIAGHECSEVADVVTDYGALPHVDGYAGELGLVFLNLLVNAAHAIEATGTRGTLRVTSRHDGDAVRITIADTGIGIPEAIKDRIYDPFFTTKAVGKGTGQGLTIAHAVITRRRGGELSFESTAGRGTTFTIRIPTRSPKAMAAAA
jgi:signal transduction histidine kinase